MRIEKGHFDTEGPFLLPGERSYFREADFAFDGSVSFFPV